MRPTTIVEIFRNAVLTYRKPDAFLVKKDGAYRPISHREFANEVERMAAGLVLEGIVSGDHVAILSESRIEWAICDFAILSIGAVVVPIFPTLPPGQIEHVLRDSGARFLFVSTPEQLAKIRNIRAELPALKRVSLIQGDPGPEPWVLTVNDLLRRADEHFRGKSPNITLRSVGLRPDSPATILYTSGTTGVPKGVVLTHWNITSNILAALETFDLRPSDTCLSFLPLSHIFERVAGFYVMFYAGVTIAYAESFETVPVNLVEVRPTILLSVPRLYEKVMDSAIATARRGGPVRSAIFTWVRRVASRYAREQARGAVSWGAALRHRIADRLVFAKLRSKLGGRIRFCISGGAPLAPEIAEFFYAAGIPIYEGYGLTETSPVIAANCERALRFGSVGRPFPGVEVRIADDGEILARGPGIMSGYYNQAEATQAAVDGGWFHTGDYGRIDEDGFLFITGRKKDLIKTAGGKYVAPQPIENLLKASRFIQEAILVGDRRKYIVALLVPALPELESYAKGRGVSFGSPAELLRDRQIHDLIRREIDERCGNLAPHEQVKRFALLERDFTISEGEVTPTLKLRRQAIQDRYAREIDALYPESVAT